MVSFRQHLQRIASAAAVLATLVFAAPALAVNQPAGHACMDYITNQTTGTFVGCYSDFETCQTVCRFMTGAHSCGFSFDSSTGKPSRTINATNDTGNINATYPNGYCPITAISSLISSLVACKDNAKPPTGGEFITCLSIEPLGGDVNQTCRMACADIHDQDSPAPNNCSTMTDIAVCPSTGTGSSSLAGNNADTTSHACMDFGNDPPLFVGSFNTMNQCLKACSMDPAKVCGFSATRTSTGVLVGTDVINSANDNKYGSACTYVGNEDYPATQSATQCDCYSPLFGGNKICKYFKMQREVWTCGSGSGATPVNTYKSIQKVYTSADLGPTGCTPSTQKDCSSYAWVCTPWSACATDIQSRNCSLQKTISADPLLGTAESIDTIANPLDACTYNSWDFNGGNESQSCGTAISTGANGQTCAIAGHWICTPSPAPQGCTPEGRLMNICRLDTTVSGCADSDPHPTSVSATNDLCAKATTGDNIRGGTGKANELPNPLGVSSIYEVLALIIRMLIGVAGSIALLGFVYGGFELIISRGDPKKVQQGKEIIKWSVLGLVLMLGAYALANALFNILNQVASTGSGT